MPRFKDISGQTFGRLTALNINKEITTLHEHGTYWDCICECGSKVTVYLGNLTSGKQKSCGCLQSENRHKKKINMIGQKFGKLTVLYEQPNRIRNRIFYHCICECGKECDADGVELRNGHKCSCGCANYSLGEDKIKTILKENNIKFLSNTGYFKDLVSKNNYPLRYDFIIFNDNNDVIRLIEFDGPQHNKYNDFFGGEEQLQILQYHDQIKNQYAKTHNIPLVRIPYNERNNITLDMLMSDKYLIA